MSDTDNAARRERPLSPHLMIYKPQITSVLSIFHRMSGVALSLGLFLVVWLLVAAASGPSAFDFVMNLIRSPIGLIFIFGWSFAFFYHMCNGVRHLFWDLGYLFKMDNARTAGRIVVLAALFLTALAWYGVWVFQY